MVPCSLLQRNRGKKKCKRSFIFWKKRVNSDEMMCQTLHQDKNFGFLQPFTDGGTRGGT